MSLGGFLAGVEAARNDTVAALVSESAGVSTWFPSAPRRMPPLLIVHSRGDPVVPLGDALRLAGIAHSLGSEAALAIYDSSDHVLTGHLERAARERIVDFLQAALRSRR